MAWVNLNEVVTTWPPTGGITAAVGDHVWTVDTFTELRAIATTDTDDISAIVRVAGHTTVGDGGGGVARRGGFRPRIRQRLYHAATN